MTVTILTGDCRDVLPTLPAGSIQMCVTSPPYYSLRDYSHPDQIGLEPTVDAYVAELVAVFREVRRVLADDGVLWLNLGDSYVAPRGNTAAKPGFDNKAAAGHAALNYAGTRPHDGLKPKDLIGVPWRVAFALQADGWWLRQDIIWSKPNPMPESVTDRCTKSHEYLFLLTKSARYMYDAAAIAEPHTAIPFGGKDKGYAASDLGHATPQGIHGPSKRGEGRCGNPDGGRNKRSVWTVATQPYADAHFATFPPKLIEPCILAGSKPGDTVLDPFGGSGTTGQVAERFGRNAILIELNPAYRPLIEKRTAQRGLSLEVA